MDILLIYPPLSVDERYGNKRLGDIGGNLPPLGIAYIAAFLRKAGFSVAIIDGAASDLSEGDILKKIGILKPKVIGFSAITPVFHRAVKLAKRIKQEFPDTFTLIGGHHASILPIEVMQENPYFDLLVYGEGELTVCQILEKYREGNFDTDAFLSNFKTLNKIDGVAFREENNIVVTQPRQHIENLDELPYPAWDLLPMDGYIPLPNQYLRKPVVHMVALRGCPYQCSFCSNNSVFGMKIRALSPQRLIETIQYAKEKFRAKEISFWDDSMTTNKRWMLELCQLLVEKKMDVTWTCYSRVDTVNKEILLWMKKAGCWNIFYGFETGNQGLLDTIGKNITLEQIRQVNQWTKEAGIEVRASFMLALPKETPQMAEKTIEFAISLEPDYAQFSITTPFPKTKLFEDAKRFGTLSGDFSKYNLWEPIFIPYGYKDRKEIEKMERKAVRKFYFRLKYIFGRIRKIRSFNDLFRYIKGLRMAIGFLK